MKKTVVYNKLGISTLADNKPVVYRIQNKKGKDLYVGVAKLGRAHAIIMEHLGTIPGTTVTILQFDSLQEAKIDEARIIHRFPPKYNRKV
ncbi:MAG: hypothetical protein QQN63_07975 [Nitrosopumilus sp.]